MDAVPLDASGRVGNAHQTHLKFAKATADANPPERELEKSFDDRGGKRRVTGPIEYANDGNPLTAWAIDIGPERSNMPRKAVFVLDKPLRGPGIDVQQVLAATRYVTPAFEIIDSRIKDWKIKFEDTVADNGSSAGFVLGGEAKSDEEQHEGR